MWGSGVEAIMLAWLVSFDHSATAIATTARLQNDLISRGQDAAAGMSTWNREAMLQNGTDKAKVRVPKQNDHYRNYEPDRGRTLNLAAQWWCCRRIDGANSPRADRQL